MWHAANMGFALCPMLTHGAIEAIDLCGTDDAEAAVPCKNGLRASGPGTMNLTEPQAGSDLGAVRTRGGSRGRSLPAVRTEDLHHVRRARLHRKHHPPGAGAHARCARRRQGHFAVRRAEVPVNADGSWANATTSTACRIEHKLGIHASPTACWPSAITAARSGYLVGEENRGLEYMFIMMNAARFSVGLQGVAIAERAYQHALDLRQGARAGRGRRARVAAARCPSFATPTCAAC